MNKGAIENFLGYDPSESLRRRYVLALSAIAFLSIVSQLLIQTALKKQEKDSYIINSAGRQRMLSQKICKLVLIIHSHSSFSIQSSLEELKTSTAMWEKFHNGLYAGDDNLNLNGRNSDEIKRLFLEVNPVFYSMLKQVKVFIRESEKAIGANLQPQVMAILNVENRYLHGMDKIVFQYQEEARRKVSLLETIEILLMVVTLAVLLLEAYFIFRPAVQRIRETIQQLIQAERRTGEAYEKLCLAEKALIKTNEELEQRVEERTVQINEKTHELEKLNQRLSRINRDLDTFVYSASHDLKGPINNIQRLFEVLQEEVPEIREKGSNLLEMMDHSLEKFQMVLKDLSETGKNKVLENEKEVSFKELLEEIKTSMYETILESGVTIQDDFRLAEKIRYTTKNLRSIMYNLISNAIKYRSPERIPLILVASEKTNDSIVLRVTDNGLGIAKEDIGKIFGIYNRLHNHVEGTGVGMNIVQRIVENYGGRIEVESEVGKGTTFKVFFKNQ